MADLFTTLEKALENKANEGNPFAKNVKQFNDFITGKSTLKKYQQQLLSANNALNINSSFVKLQMENNNFNINEIEFQFLNTLSRIKEEQKAILTEETIPKQGHENITDFISISPEEITISGTTSIIMDKTNMTIPTISDEGVNTTFLESNLAQRLKNNIVNPLLTNLLASAKTGKLNFGNKTGFNVDKLVSYTEIGYGIAKQITNEANSIYAARLSQQELMREYEENIKDTYAGSQLQDVKDQLSGKKPSNTQSLILMLKELFTNGAKFKIILSGIEYNNCVIVSKTINQNATSINSIDIDLKFKRPAIIGYDYQSSTISKELKIVNEKQIDKGIVQLDKKIKNII